MKKTQPWPGRIAFATIRVSQPGCQSAGVIDDPLTIRCESHGSFHRDAGREDDGDVRAYTVCAPAHPWVSMGGK